MYITNPVSLERLSQAQSDAEAEYAENNTPEIKPLITFIYLNPMDIHNMTFHLQTLFEFVVGYCMN